MIRSPTTLLERLAAASNGNPERRTSVGDDARLRTSILANLRRVLSTRVGHAPAQPEYGTPAASELIRFFPACIPRLQRAIGVCVHTYEPRLTAVRVEYVPSDQSDGSDGNDGSGGSDLTIRFHISAVLNDGSRTPLTFSTRVNDHGQVDLLS